MQASMQTPTKARQHADLILQADLDVVDSAKAYHVHPHWHEVKASSVIQCDQHLIVEWHVVAVEVYFCASNILCAGQETVTG